MDVGPAREAPSGMTLNAGVLRRIAVLAHDRIPSAPHDRAQHPGMDAIVAVVFSAASLEAFISELHGLARLHTHSNPPAVEAFDRLLISAEEARGTIRLKYLLAAHTFRGLPFNRGAEPLQSFDLLFRVRNAIVHLAPHDIDLDGEGVAVSTSHDWVIEQLRSRQILAEHNPAEYIGTAPNWLALLSTKALARWACNTASDMVLDVLESIPTSEFKDRATRAYRENFRRVIATTLVDSETPPT